MVKIFTTQDLQVLVNGLDKLNKADLIELIQFFPFENLVNVSIINYDLMRLHLNLLIKLSQNDIFYTNIQAVRYSLEFALVNLLSLEKVHVDDILFYLIELLKCIISRVKAISAITQDIVRDRERLFDILTFAVKLKMFGTNHVRNCTEILCDLLTMNGPLPLTTSRNLAEIVEIYKGLKVVYELAVITNIVLKRFTVSTEVFNACMQWLLIYGPLLLEENHEDNTLLELLKVMNEFYHKYSYIKNTKRHQNSNLLAAFKEFTLNLIKISDQIIKLSVRSVLRAESLKLFAVLFLDYGGDEVNVKEKLTKVLSKLLEFPTDIQKWPEVKSEMFYHICSFLCTHSRLIWFSSDILESISLLIYSYDRFSISLSLLKPLCYIYPVIMIDCLNKTTLLLGDELLIILMKFPYGFSKICTYHIAQLVWFLKRGDRNLKKNVLCQWLKREEETDVLGKAIVQCNAGIILLDIIVDCKADEQVRNKAIEMTHKINDEVLSKNIAVMIPTKLHYENVLHRLILSNPGIPDDRELAMKICEFMAMVLFLIVDENVLKAACSYCKYLVTNLKTQNDIVLLFCQNMQNIQFLTIKVKYVNEETAAEILRLLKVLVLVQKRNHNRIEETVEVDLCESLVGSPNKTEKCLDLLHIIVTSMDVFIKLNESNIHNTFLNLFQLTKEPAYAGRSFICLTRILKTNGHLAHAYSTNLFIEVQCSLSVDERSGPEFVMFLDAWMRILKRGARESAYNVPNKMTILNYIKRAGFICQRRVRYMLQLLNKLKIFPDNNAAKQRRFDQFCIK